MTSGRKLWTISFYCTLDCYRQTAILVYDATTYLMSSNNKKPMKYYWRSLISLVMTPVNPLDHHGGGRVVWPAGTSPESSKEKNSVLVHWPVVRKSSKTPPPYHLWTDFFFSSFDTGSNPEDFRMMRRTTAQIIIRNSWDWRVGTRSKARLRDE